MHKNLTNDSFRGHFCLKAMFQAGVSDCIGPCFSALATATTCSFTEANSRCWDGLAQFVRALSKWQQFLGESVSEELGNIVNQLIPT